MGTNSTPEVRVEDVQHDGSVDAFGDAPPTGFIDPPPATDLEAPVPEAPAEPEAPAGVDWSWMGEDGPDLAARHGWTSPDEAIRYFRDADSERGRVRNENGELRSQNEQLANLVDSFAVPEDQEPEDDGSMTVNWQAVEQYAREEIPPSVRIVVDHLLPEIMEKQLDKVRQELRAEFQQGLEPVQRYVGSTAVRDEARQLATQFPAQFPVVGQRVGELIMAEPARYSRPGGMREAFERAVAERVLSGQTFGPATSAPLIPPPGAAAVPPPPQTPTVPGAETDMLEGGQHSPPQAAVDAQQAIRDQIMGIGVAAGGDAFS